MGHPGWDLYPIVIDPAHAPADDGAGRYLPRFEFLLDDLPAVGEQQLRDRPLTAPAQITLLLLKIAAGNPRLAADLGPPGPTNCAPSPASPAAPRPSSPC